MNKKKVFISVLMPLLALAGVAAYGYILAGQGNQPVITNAFLDKTKYVIGDQMTITASVEDSKGIKEVKAEIDNEKGTDTVKLNLIGGDDKKGTYQASWTVHDVTGKKIYKTKVIATDSKEQSAEFVLYWIDPIPNPGHKASSVGGDTDAERTFGSAGTFTFPGQIKIQGGGPANGEVLTSDANGLATWEPAGGGLQRHAFPAPTSNNWNDEVYIDDEDIGTYTWVSGKGTESSILNYIVYDLGSPKHVLVDGLIFITPNGNSGGRVTIQFSTDCSTYYSVDSVDTAHAPFYNPPYSQYARTGYFMAGGYAWCIRFTVLSDLSGAGVTANMYEATLFY